MPVLAKKREVILKKKSKKHLKYFPKINSKVEYFIYGCASFDQVEN